MWLWESLATCQKGSFTASAVLRNRPDVLHATTNRKVRDGVVSLEL